ncbi:MAG TPA: DUF4870 domain-containing protein [Pyrinomonadaceae bacterium]|nr:DUF4870 domain-containing protein [Pyrinomonadaceae bacterium]
MQNMSGGKTALGLDTNVGAMLTYLPICGISLIYSIIVLVTEKDNRFMRFHAFQSLLLLGSIVVAWIGITIVSIVLAFVSSALSLLFGMLVWLVLLALIGLAIFMCVKAYSGAQFKLPVIGDMAEKWANS